MQQNSSTGSKKLDLDVLKEIRSRSAELIDKQISTYRGFTTKTGILLAIAGIILQIMITTFSQEGGPLKVGFYAISLFLMGISFAELYSVLDVVKLKQGANEDYYDEMALLDIEKYLLDEIAVNRACINHNDVILSSQNTSYQNGLSMLTASIVSLVLYHIITSGQYL